MLFYEQRRPVGSTLLLSQAGLSSHTLWLLDGGNPFQQQCIGCAGAISGASSNLMAQN